MNRGDCSLTPNETSLLVIPTNTTIHLAAGDGVMEREGFTLVYENVYTKSSLHSIKDFASIHVVFTISNKSEGCVRIVLSCVVSVALRMFGGLPR